MSHAKKGKCRYALCSHISISGFVLFHRAKPVTETACPALPGMKRSGIEVHGGLTGCNPNSNPIPKAGGTSPYIKITSPAFSAQKNGGNDQWKKGKNQQKKVLV